ncbi:hypothetical protein DXG01_011847 [Tephrocybe rancida]|nr:hypothetical protein DXG01_011847 [Tephrocybe rancida]
MPSPPISVFLTTIASQPALRQRQEYLLRILQVKKIPFNSYDLASDESAKRLWKRKAPAVHDNLSEDAVEYGELDSFLRLKETWNADDDQPVIPVQPIGVPGAVLPLQMTPDHLRKKILAQPPPESPLKGKSIPVNKRQGEFDISTELEGYGLQGVNVTDEDLKNLVAELGLDGDEAGDLVKELIGPSSKSTTQPAVATAAEKSEGKVDAEEAATDDTQSESTVLPANSGSL